MKKNLGIQGRIVRLLFAIILLVYAIMEQSLVAGFFSLFCFYEAFASWCIVYQLFGINHCNIK